MTDPKAVSPELVKKAVSESLYEEGLAQIQGPPQRAYKLLQEMGMIAPKEEPGFSDDVVETFSMFTDLNAAGSLFRGLVGPDSISPANLSQLFKTMDFRGVVGQYFLVPIAEAKRGFEKGKRGDAKTRAKVGQIIQESQKKVGEIIEYSRKMGEKYFERTFHPNITTYQMAKVGEDGKIVYKENGEPEMITVGRAVSTPTADTYPDFFPPSYGAGFGNNLNFHPSKLKSIFQYNMQND